MDTTTNKGHLALPLARLYEAEDELRQLGTTVAARDPLAAYLKTARAGVDLAIESLQSLQDAVPEERP
jgi:hypothetical protein